MTTTSVLDATPDTADTEPICPPIAAGFEAWERYLAELAAYRANHRKETGPSPIIAAMEYDDWSPQEQGW